MQLKNLSNKMNKKAQEEMVGFVMIMILVAVIFLVFLGIYVRQNKPTARDQNAEIAQFLDAAIEFTSECTLDSWQYLKLSELLKECDSGKVCLSGKKACDVLHDDLKNQIEASWNFGPESPNKGYKTEISRVTSTGKVAVLRNPPAFVAGCSSSKGAEKLISSPAGTITILFNICLS